MPDKQFWDSNLWIYLFVESVNTDDAKKRQTVLAMLAEKPNIVVSAQVLNEVANVLMRKYKYGEVQTIQVLEHIIKAAVIQPLTETLSLQALLFKARYQLSWFDSLIVTAALQTKCAILYTEDLQHGQVIEAALVVKNPFA